MRTFRIATLLALASLGAIASAQNLVVNPGFETGDFTGWTETSAGSGSSFGVDSGGPNSGAFNAYFAGTKDDFDIISQTIATVVGEEYTLSFYIRDTNPGGGGLHKQFDATFGTATETIYQTPFNAYEQHVLTFTATATTTDLILAGYHQDGSYYIDDVSVQAVPEPASMAALGLGAVAMLRRRKKS